MPAKKKTVTLEQIYQKLRDHDEQFVRIFEKLGDHDKRFDSHDKRFDDHDTQFANLAKQIFVFEDSFKKEIQRLDARISDIVKNLEKLTGDVETLTQEYHAITAALKRLEDRIGDFGQGKGSIREELDSLKGRLSAVEERVVVLETR